MTTGEIIIAVLGVVLATLTYFAGVKKTSNDDVAERARFEGSMSTKLDMLFKRFDKLEDSISRNISELYSEIDKKIKEHEERYHGN